MRWRAKFTHISPVWYQIRWNGTDFTLSGQHDVDSGWMARLKLPSEPVGDGSGPALRSDLRRRTCENVVGHRPTAAGGTADARRSCEATVSAFVSAERSLSLLSQGARVPKIVPRVIFELGPDAPQLASEKGMQVSACPTC